MSLIIVMILHTYLEEKEAKACEQSILIICIVNRKVLTTVIIQQDVFTGDSVANNFSVLTFQ